MTARVRLGVLAVTAASCAQTSPETRSKTSGLVIPEGADDIARVGRAGDANIYDIAYTRKGDDDHTLNLHPTSGPDAAISGGSMEQKRKKARETAEWFSRSGLCADRPVQLSNKIFDKPANAWTMRVRCGA
ncbi:MAG: hypothetical protein AAF360_18540 [Pseudomonadota bacterium]